MNLLLKHHPVAKTTLGHTRLGNSLLLCLLEASEDLLEVVSVPTSNLQAQLSIPLLHLVGTAGLGVNVVALGDDGNIVLLLQLGVECLLLERDSDMLWKVVDDKIAGVHVVPCGDLLGVGLGSRSTGLKVLVARR